MRKPCLMTALSLLLCLRLDAAAPERIISTAPFHTEVAFALGLGERMVAVSDFCEYPEQVKELPRIGGLLNPSLEVIVELKPDLVLLMPSHRKLAEQLGKLGIGVLVAGSDNLAQVYASIESVGKACGRVGAARRLRQRMAEELARTKQRAAKREKRRVLIVVDHVPGSLRDIWAATSASYLGELVTLAGGILPEAGEGGAFRAISKEEIVSFDPEVIIDLSLAGKQLAPEEFEAARRLWDKLPSLSAIKAGRTRLARDTALVVPGPRAPHAARLLLELIYRD